MTKEIVGYCFELDDFEKLKIIEKSLYGNGTSLSIDSRRNLANSLNLILSHAIPVTDKES